MRYLLLAFMTATSLSAWAGVCEYDVSLANAVVNIQESTQVIQQPFVVNRGARDNGFCEAYRVYFSKGGANSYQRKAYNSNGQSVDYNLHSNISMIGSLKQAGDAFNTNEYIQGTSPNRNQNYNNRFFISVPGSSIQSNTAGGIYTDNIQVSFYGSYPLGILYFLDTVKTFTVSIVIPTKINISVVDEGGAYDASSTTKVLNFGYLTVNQSKSADVRVVSNTPYKVQFSSLNNGKLKNSASSSVISYEMKVNNSTIGLSGSGSNPVTIGTGDRTSSAGTAFIPKSPS